MADLDDIVKRGYEKQEEVGKGTFGVVYKGIRLSDGSKVALKKMIVKELQQTEGIDFSAIREIRILRELKSDYLLVDAFIHRKSTHRNLYMVFEFMSTDLEALIKNKSLPIRAGDIKYYVHQILKGLEFLRANWIMHRDLKPGNLLLSSKGELKIGDFGLAKSFGRDVWLTPTVVTRWYRAPELLFGATQYGAAVDMWSVGCIMAEMILRIPLFPGDSELDQLSRIFAALGTPTKDQWPVLEFCMAFMPDLQDMALLPNYVEFEESPGTPLEQVFTAASQDTVNLISIMLNFNPIRRPTPEQALNHQYFKSPPKMSAPQDLLLPTGIKEETKNPNNARSVLDKLDSEHVAAKRSLVFS